MQNLRREQMILKGKRNKCEVTVLECSCGRTENQDSPLGDAETSFSSSGLLRLLRDVRRMAK